MAGRSLPKVQHAKTEIESTGIIGQLSTVQLDVTNKESIDQAAANIRQSFGRLDVLINNAGSGSIDADVMTRFRLCLDTNVLGPALVSEAFRPLLLESPRPYSIYVSSIAGSMSRASDPNGPNYRSKMPNGNAYRASKAALNMVALQESITFSSTALKVFAVCPGTVKSNINRGESDEIQKVNSNAGDPETSGEIILSIIKGERDLDAGKFVHEKGVYPW